MTIPKQPRTKPAAARSGGLGAAAAAAAGDAAGRAADVQQASLSAAENVHAAYLNAQQEQLAAYLAYVERLIQSAKDNPDPGLEYLNDVVRAQGETLATADAHRKYVAASVDRHVSGQKELVDAATAYAQALLETQQRLEEQVRQHGQTTADALKEALLKTPVRPEDAASLAILYHGLRTMSPSTPDDTGTSS